ncbi:MAG: hypothetical protein KAI16_03095 [Candidatus Pacebacteria bacterium]|nr:hypothetical protein [Candidatus Paceibacterota bacterium]
MMVSFSVVDEKLVIFSDKQKLLKENKDLEHQLLLLKNSKSQIDFYKIENKKLKENLGYQNINKEKRFVFNIVSKFNNVFFDTFFIHDSEYKIKKDDLVFAQHNLLIGKVNSRKGEMVEIKLFSSNNTKTLMFLYDGPNPLLRVEVVGEGGGIFKVLAPRNMSFENPDQVFLTYVDNREYLIGKKVDNNFKSQNTNEVLVFQTIVNPYLLNQVEILHVKDEIIEEK